MLEHDDNDEDSEDQESQEGFVSSADGDGRDRRRIRRWACEGSLESLEIGFGLETTNPNDHRLVWAHLGRLRKLRSLTLGRSNLIPSLKHGIGALVPLSVDGRGVNETMEKILSFGSMWTDSILYKLTTLTALTFCLNGRYRARDSQDMDRGLTALPHIKHLRINGRMLGYATTTGRLLTHLEIDYQPIEKGRAGGDKLIENRRLRKRRQIENRDLMLFLRICSSPRHFALKKFGIPFELLVGDSSSSSCRNQGSLGDDDDETQAIASWACKDTLETLTIGFDINRSTREPSPCLETIE
ncbi:hypothetical protein F5H01DRAFT_368033 [Linnemannia elongata]|nr:hypothetical protein F5H01DRAFT_368033 [Linnemannia elongata]